MPNKSEFRIVIVHGTHNYAGVLFDEHGTQLTSAWGKSRKEALMRTVTRYVDSGSMNFGERLDTEMREQEGDDLLKGAS